jgi:hypothetical protein
MWRIVHVHVTTNQVGKVSVEDVLTGMHVIELVCVFCLWVLDEWTCICLYACANLAAWMGTRC